jgi:hypothetical protein
MISKIPFYSLSQEDNAAYLLQQMGRVDKEGRVINEGPLEDLDYEVSSDILQKINSLFKRFVIVKGRSHKIPLEIFISLKEVEESTRQVCQREIKVIFQGNGMLNFLISLIEKIFKKWCLDLDFKFEQRENNAFLFQNFIPSPNDYDFKFELDEIENPERIVNEGLVSLLAEKLKAKGLRSNSLALELANYKNKIKNQSIQSYIKKIFANYPRINDSLPDLYHLYVRAFAFQTAVDVSTPLTCFSERKLAGRQSLPYDCLFSKKTLKTTMPLNSLYLDLTDLINQKEGNIFLQSTLGKAKRLQAISDAFLRIITFDPKKSAEKGDFAKAISLFTLGGRCYQKGWLEKIMVAFELEVYQEKNISFCELLAHQLIGRLKDHHQNQPAVLVGLAFNASTLLLTLRPIYKEKIQNLWKMIFAYLDKIEEAFPHTRSQPLIEHIQMTMRDPYFNFEDLHAQIQISAAIKQNCCVAREDQYSCQPTQTDEKIFNQIKVNVPTEEMGEAYSMMLFFQADLLSSIQHLTQSIFLFPNATNPLVRLHHVFVNHSSLAFSFGNSPLKEYAEDPRRANDECLRQAKWLLAKKNEHGWLMGYLLTLSFIAQKNSLEESKELLRNFFKMLYGEWASPKLKAEASEILHRTLSKNHFTDQLIFTGFEKKQAFSYVLNWIEAFIKTDWTPLLELAFEHMDKIERLKTKKECASFYDQILESCLALNSEKLKERPLKDILERISSHPKLSLNLKLKWFFTLSVNEKIASIAMLQSTLFDGLIKIFKQIKSAEKLKNDHKQKILNKIIDSLRSKTSLTNDVNTLSLAEEVFRLRLVDDPETFYLFWDQLIGLTPQSCERALLYQECCQDLLAKFDLWNKLDEKRRQSLTQSLLANIQVLEKSQNRVQSISKIDPSALDKTSEKTMQLLLCKSLEEKLNEEWCSEANVYMVFALLERIDWSLKENEKLFKKTLLKLFPVKIGRSPINEIARVLDNFKKNYSGDKAGILKIYFELLSSIEIIENSYTLGYSFYQGFLDSFLDLLILPKEQKGLLNQHYIEYVSAILKVLKLSEPPSAFFDLFGDNAEKFFNLLSQRGLWEEIVALYLASHAYLNDSLKVSVLILKACSQYIQNNNAYRFSVEEFNQILDKIAEKNQELNEEVVNLCGALFDQREDCEDSLGALQYLEKQKLYGLEQNDFFCDRLFRIAANLISTENCRAVYDPLIKLETPLNYESKWLEIIKLLLDQKKIDFCLELIERKISFLGMKDKKFNLEWVNLLEGMLEEGRNLFEAEDKLSLKQKEILYAIIHQLMWNCLPLDQMKWENYMYLVTNKGPINLVEEILEKLPQLVFEDFSLKKDLINLFWTNILHRFSIEPSTKILNFGKWWDSVLNLLNSNNYKHRLDIITYLIYAVYIAQKKKKSKKVLEITKLFEYVEGNIKLLVDAAERDPMLLIFFAEINLNADKQEYFLKAIQSLQMIFDSLWVGVDAAVENKSVCILNQCLEKGSLYKENPEISQALIKLINIILQCKSSSSDSNFFPALAYLHEVEANDTIKGTLSKQSKPKKYLREKAILVKLIVKNPWKENPPTQQHKDLICKTLSQIHDCYRLGIWNLAKEFLNERDLFIYISSNNKSLKKKLNEIKERNFTFLDVMISNAQYNNYVLQSLDERFFADRKFEWPKLLPDEKQAVLKSCQCYCSLFIFAIIAGTFVATRYLGTPPNLR